MTLMLIDNRNEDFKVDYEKENNHDVDEDDDAYSEPSDKGCKVFLIIYYNHSLSALIA